jgi:hypothetical protein
VKWLTTTCSSLLLLGLPAPDPLSRYENQQLSWAACPFPATDGEQSARCALVTVPRDWVSPLSGVDMTVQVGRVAAGASLGAILVNPGGPSMPGASLAGLEPMVSARYDSIGMDPRGTCPARPHAGVHQKANSQRWQRQCGARHTWARSALATAGLNDSVAAVPGGRRCDV